MYHLSTKHKQLYNIVKGKTKKFFQKHKIVSLKSIIYKKISHFQTKSKNIVTKSNFILYT